jgi:serine/threonine-protein kinase RsbT
VSSPEAAPSTSPRRRIEFSISSEHDAIQARGGAKRLADELGFSIPDAVKIATVVSELARNIVVYAQRGRIEIEAITEPRAGLSVVAIDEGPGIADVAHILSGNYRSRTGMGLGLVGSKRLVDEFVVDSAPGKGTRVEARKFLGRR